MANPILSSGESARRKRLYPNISCITVDAGCGEYELKGLSYFDVPLEAYTDGCLTGARLVYELLKEAAKDDTFDDLMRVQHAAAQVLDGGDDHSDAASKRGAAVGFSGALQSVFNFSATHLDFAEVFKRTFDCHEAYLAEQLDDMRQANAAILADLPTHSTTVREGLSV